MNDYTGGIEVLPVIENTGMSTIRKFFLVVSFIMCAITGIIVGTKLGYEKGVTKVEPQWEKVGEATQLAFYYDMVCFPEAHKIQPEKISEITRWVAEDMTLKMTEIDDVRLKTFVGRIKGYKEELENVRKRKEEKGNGERP